MILINEITIKNFLSHTDTTISFDENDKVLLDGKSGSGKSSIVDALLWCLYGKGRSDNKSLVRKGFTGTTVTLKLYEDDEETIISRSTTNKGKNTLSVTRNTGPDKQFLPIERVGLKDIQEWIERDFLKASYELFTNSVAYPQENENSFVKANASKRKDLLLEIVGANNFDELYKKTTSKLKVLDIENAVVNTKIETLDKIIVECKALEKIIPETEKEIIKLKKEISTGEFTEKSLEKKLDGISGLSKEIEDKEKIQRLQEVRLAEIKNKIKENQELIDEYLAIDIEKANKDIKLAVELGMNVKDIEVKLKDNVNHQSAFNAHLAEKPVVNDYTSELEQINARLIPLIQESGQCPAGDKCPFVIPIKGQIDFLTEQIQEKTSKSKIEHENFIKWEEEHKVLESRVEKNDLYDRLTELNTQIKELEKSQVIIDKHTFLGEKAESIKVTLTELGDERDKQIEEIDVTFVELEKTKRSLEESDSNNINQSLSEIRNSVNSLRQKLTLEESKLSLGIKSRDDAKNASKLKGELKKDISQMVSDEESLLLLKEALSPRGIKSVIVDYMVPQLEERINEILGKMSEFSIRLDTQKDKSSSDGSKEGLFITVINENNEEMEFSNYSGGEKIKIIIAISEALASIQNTIGFRIMDENIISLDKESTESFVQIMAQLQDKFPQLLIISHLQEVKDLFAKQINVIKLNGESKIA